MTSSKTSRRTAMKAGVAALAVAAGTTQISAAESDLEQNVAIATGLSKAIMARDWERVDSLIAEDFAYVADGRPAIGKGEYIGFMKNVLSTAMTDMKMSFLRTVAQNDLVAIDYTNEMTHSGEFFGIPATGKRVLATGQFMRQIKEGKIVSEWQTTNAAGLMAQLTSA